MSASAADTPKHIVPKCSAQIDPDDNKLILMVCDFSDISVADLVVDATADIIVLDKSGTSLGTQTLQFADKKNPMRGGKKYARDFEYPSAGKSTTDLKIKISSAQAVVVHEVSAVGR
jgi:hypothetical protein